MRILLCRPACSRLGLRLLLGAVLLGGAAPACAEGLWEELERLVDPEEPAALKVARQRLAALGPEAWLVERERTPLRLALAEALAPAEVVELVERAVRAPERLAALALNLAARSDLPGLLLLEPRLNVLAAADPEALEDLTEDLTVAGRPEVPLALLARTSLTVRLGRTLADLPLAAGLHTLADALTVPGRLPTTARAALAEVTPDLWNRYVERPLGVARIERLLACARSDSDPGLRVLAARLLHASLDPQAVSAVLPAYLGARSWRVAREEWEQLGSNAGLLPGFEGLPLPERLALVHGYLVRGGHVRASSDPEGAEQAARAMEALLARTAPEPGRAALARLLGSWGGTLFIDAGHARPWVAPSWLAVLNEWERAGREAGPLAPLYADLATEARRDLGCPRPKGPARRVVERPTPLVPLESEPARVRAWSRSERLALGRRLATAADAVVADARRALLADDDVALGFALAGLRTPAEPALTFASEVLAAPAARTSLRQALVAGAQPWGPSLELAPTDEHGERLRFPLDDPLRAALGRVVAEDPDPWAVDWAAQRLALAGTDADVALLLAHGERLGLLDQSRSRSPLAGLAATVLEPAEVAGQRARLDLLLHALGGPVLAPTGSGDLLEALAELLLDGEADQPLRARLRPLAERLLGWLREAAPRLPVDLVERAVLALLSRLPADDDRWAGRVGEVVRGIIDSLDVGTVRARLEARREVAERDR